MELKKRSGRRPVSNSFVIGTFLLGAASFVLAELTWYGTEFSALSTSRWILEPTPGVVLAGCFISAGSFVCGLWSGASAERAIVGLGAFVAGVYVSITCSLFTIGLGNLWPVVLVIDYVLMTPFAVVGGSVGFFVRRVVRQVSEP